MRKAEDERAGRMGAPLSKTPPTAGRVRVRDRLVARHGSLRLAAIAAGIPEQTLRRWIYTQPTRVEIDTERSLEKIGVTRDELDATE